MKSDQRSVTVGSKSMDAMWAAFAAKHQEETPPPGSMNAKEYAAKFNVPLGHVRCMLARKAEAGLLVATKVRRRTGFKLSTVMYYTPKVPR